jgi:dolichol-phosphate hexosyltransferase
VKDVVVSLDKFENQWFSSTQVIIATLNEEEGIGLTIAKMNGVLGSPLVTVVDGKSTDRTVEVAKNLGAHVAIQDGKGKGDAIAKAIAQIESTVDYVVITDADYTYPAQYVPEMIKILQKNPEIGMVCGNRLNGYEDFNVTSRVFHLGNRLIALSLTAY